MAKKKEKKKKISFSDVVSGVVQKAVKVATESATKAKKDSGKSVQPIKSASVKETSSKPKAQKQTAPAAGNTSSKKYKKESAAEADEHYLNAIRKQYESYSYAELSDEISKNEAAASNATDSVVANGHFRKAALLGQIYREKEEREELLKEEEEERGVELLPLMPKNLQSNIPVNEETRKHIASIDGERQENAINTYVNTLKDNYVFERYGDISEEKRASLAKDLGSAWLSETDPMAKDLILNEMQILQDVGAFRAEDGYIEQREKFDKNLFSAAGNLASSGTTYEDLLPAQKRSADYIQNVSSGIYENAQEDKAATFQEIMDVDLFDKSSKEIQSVIDEEKAKEKSRTFSERLSSTPKISLLEGVLYGVQQQEEAEQYKADEEFVKYNFGTDQIYVVDGRNLEMSKGLKKDLKDEISRLETERANLSGQIDAFESGASSTITDLDAAKKEYQAIEKNLAAAKEKQRVAYRFIAARQKELRSEVDGGQAKFYSRVTKNADFEENSKFDEAKAAEWGDSEIDYLYEVVNNAILDGERRAHQAAEGTEDEKYTLLTEDEKKVFNYYYNTGKNKEAMAYLRALSSELADRKYNLYMESRMKRAEEIAKEADTGWEKALNVVPTGLDRFYTGAIKNMFNRSEDKEAPTVSALASEKVRDSIGSPLGRILYDAGVSTVAMAPSIAAGSVFGPGVAAGVTLSSTFGNAYQEKINAGWTKGQATAYGMLTGLSEAGLQYFLGGISKLGGKVTGNALTSITKGIDSAAAKFALKYGGKMLSEGFEEGLQTALEPFYENLVLQYAKNDLSDVNWEEVAYSGLLGALSAGLLEGVEVYGDTFGANKMAKRVGARVRANDGASALFDAASASPASSDANYLFSRYAKQGVNAENASDLQLGRLYDATYNDAVETLESKKSTVEEMDAAQRQIKALGEITFDDIVNSGKASGNEDVYFYRSHEDRAKSNRDRNSSVVPLKNDSQSDIIDNTISQLSAEGRANEKSGNARTLENDGIGKNNDSVWERSDGSEEVYNRLGDGEKSLSGSEKTGRKHLDWGRRIEGLDAHEAREKNFAYGLLRKVSGLNIAPQDSDGRALSDGQKAFFKDTVAKTSGGELFTLYHATNAQFNEFDRGDFAFHIGTLEQARSLGRKYIKEVYVNITNPVFFSEDTMSWPALAVANKLESQGILSSAEYDMVARTKDFTSNRYDAESNMLLRKLLKDKGYDGIVYNNGFEGSGGVSFMAFDSNQIKYVSNKNPSGSSDLRYSISSRNSVASENSGVNADAVSAEMYGRAKSIFERLGFRVISEPNVENMPDNVDGYVDFKRREVYLNPNAADPMRQVIKHEIAHILERNNTRFVRSMIRMFRTDFKAEWAKAEAKVNEVYAGLELTPEQRTSEIVAEVSLELTTDAVILRTAQNNPGVMPRIKLWWNYLKLEIRKAFGHLTGGRFGGLSAEERIELASQKWKRAYEIAQKQGGRKSIGGDVQFSIAEIKGAKGSYGIGVFLDSDIFGDADSAERKRIAKDYVVNNLAGESFVAYDDSGNPIEISLAGAKEVMKKRNGRLRSVIEELYQKNIYKEIKQESVVLANELIESSKYDATKTSEYSHDWVDNYGQNDWEYRTVFLQQRDGSVWEATLNIANAADGRKILYDIDPIIKKEAGPVKSGQPTSIDSVSQKRHSVNSKYMQSGEKDAESDVSFAISRGREISDIIAELDEVDALLDNENLSDEEYRALDRRSRKLERELAIASARGSAAEVQHNSGSDFENAAEENESAAKTQRKDAPLSHHTERLRESVENYRETGDSSGIPTRKSAKHSQKYYTEQMDSIMEEIQRVDSEMRSGELTPDEMALAKDRKDMLLTRLRSAGSSANVIKDVLGVLDEIDTQARPNHRWVEDISHDLSDKKNAIKDGTYGFNDFERNVRHFFGKHFALVKEKILDPLFQSKKAYAEYVEDYSDRIYDGVVKDLGIKKGSKESAAVQWLGEGQKPMDGKRNSKTETFEEYTYEKCVKEFGKEKAEKIQKAADIFRECYDEMLDGINETRQRLYPNNPDKLIPKRKDYFRHFQEMHNSIPGLVATMKNHAGIDPMLVGVSETTKPKSKWQAAFQGRKGKRTVYDAVGGFLDYLPQAAYATHIDPNIVNIRSLAFDLASAKAKEGVNGNPNANSFIRYLQTFANKLAGKTVSHLDRAIADSTVGRPLVAALSFINNRTKANAVLGNASSVLSQFANILNAVGTIKKQTDLANGALDAVRGLFGDKEIQAKYNESGFLKERFLGKKYERFDRYGLARFAADALGIADEVGTRITWCAAYREGVRLGKADPASYADSVTRGCVAGRGIGEVPLNFESTVAKLFLPFRIEVNNNINVYRDILFGNDFEGGKAKKITANMTDAKRYAILRDKILKVAKAKPLVSEDVTEADIEKLKSKHKSDASPILKKIAEDFGVAGKYENKDVALEFVFSNRSLSKSINAQKKQYALFAKMLSVFDEVIENAIGIEVHPDKYAGTERAENTLKYAYELASVFSDDDGIYPVKLTVKEYSDRDNKLHVAIVLNKKEDAVGKQDHAETALAYSRASSNISLAQLLSIVKDEDFDKYIPKQFKNLKQSDFDKIVQNSGEDGGVVKRSAAFRTNQILKLFVASAVLNALFGALKSDEFNPLEDLLGAGEDEDEERDVFDRIVSLGKDYADGYGDGVAFDPLHGIVSGIYQGVTEDEKAGVGKKIGASALRSLQNIAGDYLSNDPLAATAIGAVGVDNDAIEKIFNGSLYVSPGTGMPAASSIAKSVGELAKGNYASAGAETAKSFLFPFGGSQVDKSVRGLYEYATGASTTTKPYERMRGADEGTLKYLIEPNAENFAKSLLFGPSSFSGANDAFYNSKRRLTEKETKDVLKLPDYESRKVTFDELISGKEYRADDAVTARRDDAAEAYKELVGKDSVIYALYKSGEKEAAPFRNIPLDVKMTLDGTPYKFKVSADEATAASEALTSALTERFREVDASDKFRKMREEDQKKYLNSIGDLEYEKIKADLLYEKGVMPEDVYVDYVFSYERTRANQDRKMFIDDAQEFVDAQAATMAQQYMMYIGDARVTDEVIRQVQKYTDYATHRAPTNVDKELMRLSNSLQSGNADLSDLNACGNPSGVISYTKKGVEYYIDVPDTMTYQVMAMVDDGCRSALSTLFSSSAYKNASDSAKKDLISKTKSKVRKQIKESLKAQFPSVRVDEFQKIVDMGGK